MYWVIYYDEIAESFYTLKDAQEYIKLETEDGDSDDYWIIEGVRTS